MARQLNIACLQTRPMPDFKAALAEALPMAEQAVKIGASFLFLPEARARIPSLEHDRPVSLQNNNTRISA